MPFNYKTELHRYKRYYQSIHEVTTKPQTRGYMTAIFSFLAISLFGWYAIRPTVQTILVLQKEIEDNRLVNQQMEEKINKLIDAHATYQSIADDIPYVAASLPPAPDALSVVEQIRNIAAIRGASISAISSSSAPLLSKEDSAPTTTKTTKVILNRKVKSIQFSVTIIGTYDIIEGIIEDILAMKRIVTIESISITPNPETEQLKLAMRVNAHYIESE